jgi:hypothetical protein
MIDKNIQTEKSLMAESVGLSAQIKYQGGAVVSR